MINRACFLGGLTCVGMLIIGQLRMFWIDGRGGFWFWTTPMATIMAAGAMLLIVPWAIKRK